MLLALALSKIRAIIIVSLPHRGWDSLKTEEVIKMANKKAEEATKVAHPKHENVLNLIRTAEGDLKGIEKMILDDRYCLDISKQLLAVISILRKANLDILKKHMETCVKDAAGTNDFDTKIKELESIVDYITKGKGE